MKNKKQFFPHRNGQKTINIRCSFLILLDFSCSLDSVKKEKSFEQINEKTSGWNIFKMFYMYMVFILSWGFLIPYGKLGWASLEPMTLCLLCTHSSHWAIWPIDDMCLMVYRIKWPWTSSHGSVIPVARFKSHLQLTFYISSTSTLTQS